MNTRLALLVCAISLASGCNGGGGGGKPVVTTGTADASGGEVVTESGISVTFPAGALDEAIEVVITETGTRVRFEPDGLVFGRPVAIRMPLPGGADDANLFWSRLEGAVGFDELDGTATGDVVRADVVHFSEGFLGKPTGTRSVVGVQVAQIVSGPAIELVPVDLTGVSFRAYVTGSGGALVPVVGTGFANGTFTIPDVPDGPYLLRADRTFVATDAGVVDLGFAQFTRRDAVPLENPVTAQMHLQLSNLIGWQATDQWQLFSPIVDDYAFGLATSHPLAAGSSSMDVTIDAGDLDTGFNAITPPDELYVSQLTTTDDDGIPYLSMRRLFSTTTAELVDSETDSITGAFTDVSGAATGTFDFRGSEFWALRSSITPSIEPDALPLLDVFGQPGSLEHGSFSATPDYLIYTSVSTADTMLTNASWGEIPGGFETAVLAVVSTAKPYLAAGASVPHEETGGIASATSLAEATSGPIAPRMSPVRNPKLDGGDLFAPASGVGLTPTFTWDPPAVGTATRYSVRIRALVRDPVDSSRTRARLIATFHTSQTSVTVPPGVLEPGGSYMVRIRASDPPFPASIPNRTTFPLATADVLSAVFSPNKRVFVGSSFHTPDFGGLAGGDSICNARAAAAGLGGTWKAWLSDSITDAIDRLADVGPWFRLDGAKVFENLAGIPSFPLAPITTTELGVESFNTVWTGTFADGTHASSCNDWSSTSGVGAIGDPTSTTTGNWTGLMNTSCSGAFALYCFEQ